MKRTLKFCSKIVLDCCCTPTSSHLKLKLVVVSTRYQKHKMKFLFAKLWALWKGEMRTKTWRDIFRSNTHTHTHNWFKTLLHIYPVFFLHFREAGWATCIRTTTFVCYLRRSRLRRIWKLRAEINKKKRREQQMYK